MKTIILLAVILAGGLPRVGATPLTESTFTEVIKDVNRLSAGGAPATAKLNDVLTAPDRVRTGADSRAELTAPDQTLTRVGANTVFAFATKDRVINLEKGSLLFHSPTGKGGGTIKSGGASAAVLGTTIIVVATLEGGFKVIVLEGKAKVTLPNKKFVTLQAGQLVFVLADGKGFSQAPDFNLGKLVGGSLLVGGFAHELPSLALVKAAVQKQKKALANGRATDTGVSADEFAAARRPGNGLSGLDHNSYGAAIHPPLTPAQLAQLLGGPVGNVVGPGGGPGGAGVVQIIRGPNAPK